MREKSAVERLNDVGNDERKACAIGFEMLARLSLGYVTDEQWSVFSFAFWDKFGYPPTRELLYVKYHEFTGE